MGYFRYLLKKIFYKIPKKILVFIIIFLLLFFFNSHNVHAVDHVVVDNLTNADTFNYLKTVYDGNWYRLVYRGIQNAKNNNNTFNADFKSFCSNIINAGTQRVWYIDSINTQNFFFGSNMNNPITTDTNQIYFGDTNLDNETQRTEQFFTYTPGYSSSSNSSRTVRCYYYNRNANIYRMHVNGVNKVTDSGHIMIPEGLERYCPNDLYPFIQSIANNTFDFESTNDILANIDNHIQETNQQLNELNDYLQDTTTSQYSQNDLPSDSMSDITASGFNNIFTRIYNSVTSNSNQTVTITIPYLDYPVSVNSYFMYNTLNNNGFGAIITIIDTVYFGLVSLYIIKDIYKYINQIKNGDIGHTDTNIKTEVL